MNPFTLRSHTILLRNRLVIQTGIIILTIMTGIILTSGCIAVPSSPPPADTINSVPPISEFKESEAFSEPDAITAVLEEPIPVIPTSTPEPTSSVTIADTPYSDTYERTSRQSIFFSGQPELNRTPLHSVYTEPSIRLANQPVGRMLDVRHGPFEIHYTVHPQVQNQAVTWAILTVRDPFGNKIAEDGYHRHYTSSLSNAIKVYGSGKYHLTMEGEFVTIDISLCTADPVPEPTVTVIPPEEYDEEEEMWG